DVKNVTSRTDAEIEKLKAEYAEKIAALDAERQKLTGEADAQVTKMKETARSNLTKLKLDVFQNDGSAYLRYSMAEQLNPKMVLRLFHAGPGTLWTNMEGKNISLLMPTPGTGDAKPAQDGKPAVPGK